MNNNISLGYFPDTNEMNYSIWCDTFGRYRWYHENGDSRTFYSLDYEWKRIYDKVTSYCDIVFQYKHIFDINSFTSEFLNIVPLAWLKFKTELEFITGDLSGLTIDPETFNAGYNRVTDSKLNSDFVNKNKSDNTQNIGKRDDISHSANDTNYHSNISSNNDSDKKARQIGYNQGVQAYDNMINNENIGLLGNDFASAMSDGVTIDKMKNSEIQDYNNNQQINGTNTTGAQTINLSGNTDNDGKSNDIFHEEVKETRVNFYDNLAFLKTRIEFMDSIVSFDSYFEKLFTNVSVLESWF